MNAIQSFQFNDIPVSFREDGFLNATAIAAHFGKFPKDYLKNEQTQQYITALAENLSVRRKILTKENQIVIVKRGGSEQGTWLHPKLAIHLPAGLTRNLQFGATSRLKLYLTAKFQTAYPSKPPPMTAPLCGRPSPRLSDAKA